jgi:uncharacterized protein YoxC
VLQKWILDNLVALLALGVGVLVALGGFVAFTMTTLATRDDVEVMTAPLATKEAVAELPTGDDIDAVDDTVDALRETVAGLGATVSALSAAVDAQRETIDTLSEAVDTQRETVGQVYNMVIALSGTVDRINEAAVRIDGAVGTLDGRLDSLTNIVSPLVPCVIDLHHGRPMLTEAGTPQLPASCEQARDRARLPQ